MRRVPLFTDAFLQTTYETKQKYEMAGKIVTPIYERHYWLNDMSELKTVKRDFDEHLKACFDESFWQVYGEISALPGVLDTEIYEKKSRKYASSAQTQPMPISRVTACAGLINDNNYKKQVSCRYLLFCNFKQNVWKKRKK